MILHTGSGWHVATSRIPYLWKPVKKEKGIFGISKGFLKGAFLTFQVKLLFKWVLTNQKLREINSQLANTTKKLFLMVVSTAVRMTSDSTKKVPLSFSRRLLTAVRMTIRIALKNVIFKVFFMFWKNQSTRIPTRTAVIMFA